MGEGIVVYSPESWVFTSIGEVPQGTLTTAIKEGINLVGSQVPQAGLLSTDLRFPWQGGVIIHGVDRETGALAEWARYDVTGWQPEEPIVGVTEAFFVESSVDFVWERNFSVNGGGDGNPPPPPPRSLIAEHPKSIAVKRGAKATLRVSTVENEMEHTFQWYYQDQMIPGATAEQYEIPETQEQHEGNCLVKVRKGLVEQPSIIAHLSVTEPPLPLAVTHFQMDRQNRVLHLTWNSEPEKSYAVDMAAALGWWVTLVPYAPSQGVSTSISESNVPVFDSSFFRVRELSAVP